MHRMNKSYAAISVSFKSISLPGCPEKPKTLAGQRERVHQDTNWHSRKQSDIVKKIKRDKIIIYDVDLS